MKSYSPKPYDLFEALDELLDKSKEISEERRKHLCRAVAIAASDPAAVSLLVDMDGDDWANIYPPLKKEKPITTGQAIDTFIDTYGKSRPGEEELLEKLIFNPVPDYSEVLVQEEEKERMIAEGNSTGLPSDSDMTQMAEMAKEINGNQDSESDYAESTTENVEKSQSEDIQQEDKKEEENRATSSGNAELSLELAKIFVKQGQFERAYEIIYKINLNNPKKNVYFADQLRFLEKLIKIKQLQNKA